MNFGELLEEASRARVVAAADIPFNMPAGAIAHPRFSPPAAVVPKSIFASSPGLSLALQTSVQEAAQGELANAWGVESVGGDVPLHDCQSFHPRRDLCRHGRHQTRSSAAYDCRVASVVPVGAGVEVSFLRFCKQQAEGVWAVVDVSVEAVRNGPGRPVDAACRPHAQWLLQGGYGMLFNIVIRLGNSVVGMASVVKIIDGKAIAQTIRHEIASQVLHLSNTYSKVPGLAVVIVGTRKDSQSYVSMKRKACCEVGIKFFDVGLPEDVTEDNLVEKVHELNRNPDVHGILIQLPLPKHINEDRVLNEVSIEKDVEGFHPLNIGKLAMKGRDPLFVPCTPKGCLELLKSCGVSVKGKKAVVVGRSNIVGLPVSLLLLKADATVSVVHSRTSDPENIIRQADIIIAAAGQAMMIKGDWIKPGAAVIDVGMNAVNDPSTKTGYRLVGNVDFEEAKKVAGYITPVPGGVGPMTVAMLLQNTLNGAKRKFEL